MIARCIRWAVVALVLVGSPFARGGVDGVAEGVEGEAAGQGAVAVLQALGRWGEHAAGNARACTPMSDTVYGYYGGYFTLNGTVCNSYGEATVSYHDYGGVPGAVANGTMTIGVSFDNPYSPSTMTFRFNGGPVRFRVNGQLFTVTYDNVRLNYGISYYSVWLSSVSGGLVINGQWVSMSNALVPYMF